MSLFRNSAVGDLTRGGQTTIHFMRMIWQVTKKFFKICLFFYLFFSIAIFYYSSTEDERYYSFKYSEAYLFGEVFKNNTSTTDIRYSNGVIGKTSYASILNSRPVLENVDSVFFKLWASFGFALFVAIAVGFFMIRFIYSTGKSQASDDFVRGTDIVDIKV